MKIRQTTVLAAFVVGVTGDPAHPTEVILGRRDSASEHHRIGLSLPLSPTLRSQVGDKSGSPVNPAARVSTGVFGRGQTEYRPVVLELVVEVEAEASLEIFTNRLRPRVYRLRTDY
ncbi:hypothetical protein [Amycolatopsis sp. NPDC050768]|uniref:hypothetical protein n=1 Tax=Amycolatopsis sp. NPDC050768 TaxID=3154839 RepID=UPI003401678E